MLGLPITIDPNRYEILAELGRGGMGVVFKARDRETGDIVALKVLKPEIADDPAAIERFKNELRLARKITHKNVCRIYEFNRSDAFAYISMEFVDGENLQAILRRTKRLEIGEGVRIARQICAGLREAHLQGIIHRDLKPANIMIASDGSPKVMDFGIARSVDTSATATGMVVGTPSYIAPEQAEGKAVDPRTDIYTLGLILYEIFTGKVAFTGDSALSVALKQIHETPPLPREIQPSLPPYIETVILRCLQKDPALRFQSVDELDAALAGESPAEPLTKEPSASLFRTLGRTLRNPVWLSVAFALALFSLWFLVFRSDAKFEISFKEFTLKNGMRVIVSEDHSAPTFTICVTYNVGSRNERPGQSGFAHLFEHLMFQGSANVGKGEHLILVQNHGGSPNGNTMSDFTVYYETLPANQLDLALFLEADRMRSLDINQAKLASA